MSLRIAFFVHSFPTVSETFILRQVTGLRDRGHTVHVFANHPAAPEGGVEHPDVDRYALRQHVEYVNRNHGRLTIPERIGRWPGILATLGRYPAGALDQLRQTGFTSLQDWLTILSNFRGFAGKRPYDVVHCHFGDLALKFRGAAAYWRAPLVASFYGYDCSSYPREHGARVFEPLFAMADAVTALSGRMGRDLEQLGCPPQRIRILRIGVDPDRFRCERQARSGEAPVRLLTVARLVEKKGIEVALRAVADVAREFPRIQYDVIGEGPLRPRLEEQVISLGLEQRVRFLGLQSEGFVQHAMCEADIFLLPSVTAADGDQEGTPTVLMEASSYQLPVVSTLHAGIPEVVLDGETGFLVPEGDAEALGDRLRYLITHPEVGHAFGAAGRRHIEAHFDTRKLSEQLERLYEEVLRRTPDRAAVADARRPTPLRGRVPEADEIVSRFAH